MPRVLTKAQQDAMARGRKRADAVKRREARVRVRAYQRWLSKGGRIPEIPSDADYRIARGD